MVNSVNNNESFIPFFITPKISEAVTTAIAQNLNEPPIENSNKGENDKTLEQQPTTLNHLEELKKLQHIFNAHQQNVQQLSKESHHQKVLETHSQTTSALMIDLCFQRRLKALAELEKEISVLLEKNESITENEYDAILNHFNTAMATDNALINLLTYKAPIAEIIKDKTIDCLNHPLTKSALSALPSGTQLFFTTQAFSRLPTIQSFIAASSASILAYAGLTGISKIYNSYIRSPTRNESFSNAMIYTIEQISSSAANLLELTFPGKDDQQELKNQYSTLANNSQLTLGELHHQINVLLTKVKKQINNKDFNEESKKNIHQIFWQVEGLIKSLDVIAGVRNQVRKIDFNQIDNPNSTLQIPGENPNIPLLKELTEAALWSPKTTVAAIRSEEKDWPIKLQQSGQIYNGIKTFTKGHDAFTQNLKKAQEAIEFVKNCQRDKAKANDLSSSDLNEAIEHLEKTVEQFRVKVGIKNYFTSNKHQWPDIREIEKSIAALTKANAELEELMIKTKSIKANPLLEGLFAAGFSKEVQNIAAQWKKNINISITPLELNASLDKLIKSIYPLCQQEIQKDLKIHQPLIDILWNEKELKQLLFNKTEFKTLSLASLTPECRKKYYLSWMQVKSRAAKATTLDELIICKQEINKNVAAANALTRLLTHKPSYHIKNLTVNCLNKPITKSALAVLSSVAGLYFGINSQNNISQTLLQCLDYKYSNATKMTNIEDYIKNPMLIETQADVPSTLPITLAVSTCLPIITYAGITAASSLYNKYWHTTDCNASFSNAMMDTINHISSSIKEALALKYHNTGHEYSRLEKQCLELSSHKQLTLEQLSVSVAKLLLEIRSRIATSDLSKEKIHQICYKIEGLVEGLNDLSVSHNQMRMNALNKINGDLSSFRLFSEDSSIETIFDKLIQSVSWSHNTTIATIESDEKDWPDKEAQIKKIYDSFNSSARAHKAFEETVESYPNHFPDVTKLLAREEEALVALQRNYPINTFDLAGLKHYQDEAEKRNKSLQLASSATSQLKTEYEAFDVNLQKIDSWIASHKGQGIKGNIQELETAVQEIRQKHLPENSSQPITSITTALDALEKVKRDNEQLPIILKECEENFEHAKNLSDQLLSNIQKFIEQLHDYGDKTSEIENYYRISLSPVHQLIQKNKDKMLSLQTKIKNLTDLNISNFKQYKEMLYNEIRNIRAQLKQAPNISKAYSEHKNFLIYCKKTEDRIEFLKSLTPPQFLAAAQLEEELNSLKNPSGLSLGFLTFLLGSLPTTANTFFDGMTLNPLTPLKNPTIALRKLGSPIESMIWGILISGAHTAKLRRLLAFLDRRTPSMSLPAQLSVNRYSIPNMITDFLPKILTPSKKVGKYEQALRTEYLKEVQVEIENCKSKLEACQKNLDLELANYIHPGWYNTISNYIIEKINDLHIFTEYYHIPKYLQHPYWISMPFGIFRPGKYKLLWRHLYTEKHAVDYLNPHHLECYKKEMNRMTEGIIKNLNDITYLPTIDQHYTDLITSINKARALADSLEAKHHPLAAESLRAVCREVKQNLFDNNKQVCDLQRMKLLAATLTTARDTVNNTISLYKFLENRPNTILDRIQALPEDLQSSAAQTAHMLIIKDIKEVIRTFISDINKGKEALKALDEKALIDPIWREALSQELKNSLTEISQYTKGLKIPATRDASQSVIPSEKLKKGQLLAYYKVIETITSKTINGKKNEASHFIALEQIPIIEKLDKSNDQLQKSTKGARKFLSQYSDLNAAKNTETRAQGIKSLQFILDYTQSMGDIMIRRMGCLLETKECIAFLENSQQTIEKAIKNIKENKPIELGTWGQMKALEFENPEIPLSPHYGSANADVNTAKHMTLRDKILTGVDLISEQRTKLALSAAKQAIAIGNQYDLVGKEDANAIAAGWRAVGERLGCEEDLTELEFSEMTQIVNNKFLSSQIQKKGFVFAQSLCETAAIAAAEYLMAKKSTKNVIIASVAKVAGDIGCKLPAKKTWDESFTNLSPLDSSSDNENIINNDNDDDDADESINSDDSENVFVSRNKNSVHSNDSKENDNDNDNDSDSSDNKKIKPFNLNISSHDKQDNENSIKGAKAAGKAVYTVMCNIIDKDSTRNAKDKQMEALIASGMGAAYYSFPEDAVTPSEAGKLAGKAAIATLSALKQKNIKNSEIRKIAGIAAGFAAAVHAIPIGKDLINIATTAAKAAASTSHTLFEGSKEKDRESIIETSAIAAGIAGALYYESSYGENTYISRASRNAAVSVMNVIANMPLTTNSTQNPALNTVFDIAHAAAKAEALASSDDKDRINDAAIKAAIKAAAPIKYNDKPSISSIQGNLNIIEDNLNKYNDFITPLIDRCQSHIDYEDRLQKWKRDFEKWDHNYEGPLAAPVPPPTNKPYHSSIHELMLELQKEIKNAKKRIGAIKLGLITSTHTIVVDDLKSSDQLIRFTRQCMHQSNYIHDKVDRLVKKINNKSKKIIVKPIPLPEKFSWPLST